MRQDDEEAKEEIMLEWEKRLNDLIIGWSQAHGILPHEVLAFMVNFIAHNLRSGLDEEDIRSFCHDVYRLLIRINEIKRNA